MQTNENDFNSITNALHCKIDTKEAYPVVTPLYQNSAFQANSPYFYTRKDNPNCKEFENIVATIEDAAFSISTTTGMAALNLVLSLLESGDRLVINKYVYGCSMKFFLRFAKKRKIELTILDLSNDNEIDLIPKNVTMVIFETPTNPFLKTINIADVTTKTKSLNKSALIVVDNTWATSLFQQPMKQGADISLHSATKFFSGHSDVMGGIILTNNSLLSDKLRTERFYTGAILDPHSAWLLCRSLQTFTLRMTEHQRVTKLMIPFLKKLPQIKKVYMPEIDGKQLVGYGGIIFFDLRDDLVQFYKEFSEALSLFDTGTAMACVTSMVAQPFSGSHASLSDSEKNKMGLGRGLIRLCFGLENVNDLMNDIILAFKTIETISE